MNEWMWQNSWAFYGLLLAPVIPLLFYLLASWRQSVHRALFEKAPFFRSASSFWIRTLCLFAIWIFGILALAAPKGSPYYVSAPIAKNVFVAEDILLVLDGSQSMQVDDTSQGVSRLSLSIHLIQEMAPALAGHRVALWLLTDQAIPLVPLTTDLFYLLFVLDEIQKQPPSDAGTNFSSFIQHVLSWDQQVEQAKIFLFSDGEDPLVALSSLSDRQEAIQTLTSSLQGVKVPIIAVGIGSTEGGTVPNTVYEGKPVHSSLNTLFLAALANQTDGMLILSQKETFSDLTHKLIAQIPRGAGVYETAPQVSYTSFFYFPLGVAILLFLVILFLPEKAKEAKEEAG